MSNVEPLENVTARLILADGTTRKFSIPLLFNVAQGFRYIQQYLDHNKLPRAASIRFTQDEPSTIQVEEDLNKHSKVLDEFRRKRTLEDTVRRARHEFLDE